MRRADMMHNHEHCHRWGKLLLLLVLVSLAGCGADKDDADDSAEVRTPSRAQELGTTVAAVCELIDYQQVNLQAYSLVVGLPNTGSSEVPASIRRYLVDQLRKLDREVFLGPQYSGMTAEEILESRTTALVMVQGSVPAGAPKGESFDVTVRMPGRGTQTTSLQGGYLMRTEMRIVTTGLNIPQVAGRPTGLAGGPVFVNPFSQAGGRTSDPRQGVVLGGGRSLYDRSIKLSLLEPDYRMAWTLQNRINARFQEPDMPRVAEGSRSTILLAVPNKYRERYQHFIALVLNMYVRDTSGYLDLRLRELNQLAQEPDADYESLALAWEAIGRPALVHLKPFYQQRRDELAYYAARTALYMEDYTAIDALLAIANTPDHPQQLPAVHALQRVADNVHARRGLLKMLEQENARLRLLAYQGLRQEQDHFINSIKQPGGFHVDMVPTPGDPLICIWATKGPRVVLFGGDMPCSDDIFLESRDGIVTISTTPEDENIRILRQVPGRRGQPDDFVTLSCKRRVLALIETLARPLDPMTETVPPGAELSFSQIAGILYQLQLQNGVDAQFVLHRFEHDLLR